MLTSFLRRLADFLRGLASLALVLLLLVGVPALLVGLVGSPLPTEPPSVDRIRTHLADGDIPDAFLIKTLAVVVWLVWVQLAVATIVELVGLARGRISGRAPVLPGIQAFVGKLVASTVLLTSAFGPTRSAVVAPIAAPILAVGDHLDPGALDDAPVGGKSVELPRVGGGRAGGGAGPTPTSTSTRPSAAGLYTTRSGDTWWDLSERLLDDGLRWRELRDLNIGRTMATGEVLTGQTEAVRSGWQLVVPADADAELLDPVPASDRAGGSVSDLLRPAMLVYDGPTGAPAAAGPAYQVMEGDNLWDIAERHLGDPFRWPEIHEASTGLTQPFGQQLTDPNLIWPDWILVLPADAVNVPPARADLVREVLGSPAPAAPVRPEAAPPAEPAPPPQPAASADPDPQAVVPEAQSDPAAPTADELHRLAEQAADDAATDGSPSVGVEAEVGPAPVGSSTAGSGSPTETEDPVGAAEPGDPAPTPPTPPGRGAPAALALGSGALLVATGLLGLLRRARRLRLAETGERSVPQPPPMALAEIETVLRNRADAPSATRLVRALASLAADVDRVDEPWAVPEAVRVTGGRIEALVQDPGAPFPAPWRELAVDGGALPAGRRAVVAELSDLAAIGGDRVAWSEVAEGGRAGGEPAPVPTLVTVGGGLLLNLEAVGVVALAGDDRIVAGLSRAIVHELAMGVGSVGSPVPVDILVSDRLGGIDLHPTVRSGPLERLGAQLEPWLLQTELGLVASGAASPHGLRLASADVDPGVTVIVAHGADLTGTIVRGLVERARDRRFPLAVVIVGDPPSGSIEDAVRPAMTVVAGADQIRLDPLGLVARAPDLDLDLLVGVEALIDHARRAPIVPRPEPAWAQNEVSVTEADPVALVPPPIDGSDPAVDPHRGADLDPGQVPTEETPEHEIATEIPDDDEEITDRSDDDDTGLLVRVLGPVDIEGGPVGLPEPTELQRSIVAFLALAGPSTLDQIVQAVSPGDRVGGRGPGRAEIEGAMADLASRLGPLFPTSGDGRHRVRSTITDLGSARRWIAQAAGLSDERARNLLHLALNEVRGRPFAGVDPRRWQWIEDHRLAIATQASSLLIDACFDLCDSAYEADDVHLALWACEVASLVDPLQETVVIRRVQLLALLDRDDEATAAIERWEEAYENEVGRPAPQGPRSALAAALGHGRPPGPGGGAPGGAEVVSHVG